MSKCINIYEKVIKEKKKGNQFQEEFLAMLPMLKYIFSDLPDEKMVKKNEIETDTVFLLDIIIKDDNYYFQKTMKETGKEIDTKISKDNTLIILINVIKKIYKQVIKATGNNPIIVDDDDDVKENSNSF